MNEDTQARLLAAANYCVGPYLPCMSLDCWDVFLRAFPEYSGRPFDIPDISLGLLFTLEMERTGDLP